MNIAMFTNTFTPHVGGVARSVQGLVDELRRLGHHVLVVAPRFEGVDENENGVLRIPAVQNFNGSDFSLPMPVPITVARVLKDFQPDIVHSHHPFLLGETALRIAVSCDVPVVFTHHTRYEQYTHYLPGDSAPLKHFVIDLVGGYCNLCNAVIAPSRSIADMLQEQGIEAPIEVIPTGVDPLYFAASKEDSWRDRFGLAKDVFMVGHVGRLAPEKNLSFLGDSVCRFLQQNPAAHFLLIGEGPAKEELIASFARQGLQERIHLQGVLDRRSLAKAYRCMDVFVFTSQSETQGLVIAEAMAAGTPVVAIDAPGVREVVVDTENGRLLPVEELSSFVQALDWVAQLPGEKRDRLRQNAKQTAEQFSLENTVRKMLDLYNKYINAESSVPQINDSLWQKAGKRISTEFEILKNYGHAIEDTIHWLPLTKELQKPEGPKED
ncbi:glycosyltransferase family 4 protein [Desulfopila sp. IMCC35006]|uniref:glycosyltransferase n=1 Tax=Desulfopila sp. IMCC35006 TaxID=2569542 RepID=UPI0010AD7C14|nr:glycosyltransferase [Desulfopila sp. IMCC35006]TKB27442.1 glycosyltransferase family 4 protein [Desulfopila sp. IMCC35006]